MIKLRDATEIGMYYDGKKRNMKDTDIQTCIEVLRIIKEL